jgi:hypothetical protein
LGNALFSPEALSGNPNIEKMVKRNNRIESGLRIRGLNQFGIRQFITSNLVSAARFFQILCIPARGKWASFQKSNKINKYLIT